MDFFILLPWMVNTANSRNAMVILKGPWKMCNVAEEPKDVTVGFFHPSTHRKQWQWLEDPTATLQHTPVSQSSTSSQRTGPPIFCEGVSYLEVQTSRARPGQIPESVPWKGKTRISDYVSRGFALNHTLLQTGSIRRRGTIAALQGLRTGVESSVSGPKDTK